jgi:sortase A
LRVREIRRRIAGDPFLKLGIATMALALGFAAVVGFFAFLERPQRVAAKSPAEESTSQSLVRSDPGVEPWQEKEITASAAGEYSTPQPESTQSETPQPESEADRNEDGSALPLQEDGYPLPTQDQIASAEQPRRYHLPPGAIMALTIPELGIKNAPVMDSVTESALNQGVVHLPDTSLPWSDTPERNVYLAGHRLGWPGTGSHLIFYRLNELTGGERITLRARDGTKYDYKVLESFAVWPDENWVTGRVRDRDLLTLQTCTPIPTFQKRLIVRAERI